MKNEKEQIRNLFETLSPDKEQLAKMENVIISGNIVSKRRRVRPAALIAAVVMIAAGVTAVSASPALRRYFFPDTGVVELAEDADPLYLMLDMEDQDHMDFRCQYGYWYDGSAQFWIESQTRYEEITGDTLMPETVGTVELLRVTKKNDGELLQEYRITIPDISAEDAMKGFAFDGNTIRYGRVPAQYHPYTAEDNGICLTLIPLTEDMTAFAAEAEYAASGVKVNLTDHYTYYMDGHAAVNSPPSMVLVTENGREYPLSAIGTSGVFSLAEKPSSPISGFRSDALTFTSSTDKKVVVTVEMPEEGEAAVLDLEFTFPDMAAKGRIHAVGCSNPITDTEFIDRETEFPMGFLSVITDIVDQSGIRYWYGVQYTEEFEEYMSQFYENVVKTPYDYLKPILPMAPKTRISTELEGQMHYTFHYVPDGSETVDLVIDGYLALAEGCWDITFHAE